MPCSTRIPSRGGSTLAAMSPSPPISSVAIKSQSTKILLAKISRSFDWKSTTYGEENYNLTKNSPYIELLDLNDNVIAQCYHQLKEAKIIHDIDVVVKMPDNSTGPIKVRIAAWNADTNTPGAVKHVEISNQVNGDVNGDGMINVSDITKLVNVILGIIDLLLYLLIISYIVIININDLTNSASVRS